MRIVICLCAFVTCHSLLVTSVSHAGISDRVIAFVEDQAITMSELADQHQKTVRISPDVSIREVLNTMIHRVLLLREARKYRIEASSPEQVMREFIDLKVRAFIRVGDAEVEQFSRDNPGKFAGREYDDVRDEIEKYLTEKELNERLKEMLRELKAKAYIRTYLEENP